MSLIVCPRCETLNIFLLKVNSNLYLCAFCYMTEKEKVKFD